MSNDSPATASAASAVPERFRSTSAPIACGPYGTARPAPSAESSALTVIAAELLRRAYTADETPVTEDELRGWSLRAKAVSDAIR